MILNFVILGIFFLLELISLAVFGYWGFHVNVGLATKVIIGVGTPLLIAILWGMFLSPKASIPIIPSQARTLVKLFVFLLASVALYASGQSSKAMVFLVIAVLETALIYILKL
jgi:hypothetical protein